MQDGFCAMLLLMDGSEVLIPKCISDYSHP